MLQSCSSSFLEKSLPVGLCGELQMNAFFCVLSQGSEFALTMECPHLVDVHLMIRLQHHHAIARLRNSPQRTRNSFSGSQRDGDLCVWVWPKVVESLVVVCNASSQFWKAEATFKHLQQMQKLL
eukprot:GHVS01032203.1.p2 GENE.GHVS01032203.1~~GHVS01032203.1.p2  ORF type:complete len:124 (-),score=5.94 GHVS01032203.1:269-640(-)